MFLSRPPFTPTTNNLVPCKTKTLTIWSTSANQKPHKTTKQTQKQKIRYFITTIQSIRLAFSATLLQWQPHQGASTLAVAAASADREARCDHTDVRITTFIALFNCLPPASIKPVYAFHSVVHHHWSVGKTWAFFCRHYCFCHSNPKRGSNGKWWECRQKWVLLPCVWSIVRI